MLQNGKKVMKKKTSVKKDTRSPVFNEAMIFSVPAPALHVRRRGGRQGSRIGVREQDGDKRESADSWEFKRNRNVD